MNQRGIFSKYLSSLLWVSWILFLIFISYKTRFWINNDTIGSLDSARYIKALRLDQALNGYWGLGYAFFLSLLPMKDITSWIQVHYLIAVLILLSQMFIYLTLVALNIRNNVATILCIIWGAINYSTGGGLFITADTALGFFASFYLLVATKAAISNNIYGSGTILLLSTLHGFAWLTKTVALPGLMLFPAMISLSALNDSNNIKVKLTKAVKFIVIYSLPLLVLIFAWGYGTYLKYGRFTLGFSSPYTNALYVEKSDQLAKAREKARYQLPPYGTYWWSDIGLSFSYWDFKFNFNLKQQLERFPENIDEFIKTREIRDGFGIILLLLLSLFSIGYLRYKRPENYFFLLAITLTGYSIIFIYSAVLLNARYLPFATIFLLPVCGIYIERILIGSNKNNRIILYIILLVAALHGIASMIYASIYISPNGEHFIIANKIRDNYQWKNNQEYCIGAFFSPNYQPAHHAIIANILNVQTAEIKQVKDDLSTFSCSFNPSIILLALNNVIEPPHQISLNSQNYIKVYSGLWVKGREKTQLTVYK